MRQKQKLKAIHNYDDHVQRVIAKDNRLIKTFPDRILKGVMGFFMFIPLTAIAFGIHCFKTNQWPWSEKI